MTQRSIRTLALAAAVGTTLWLAPVASAHVELEATLDSDQETDAMTPVDLMGHDPSGTASLTFDFETKTIQYEITVNDLTGPPTLAHIHQGVAGVAGGVLGCCTLNATTLSGTTGALTDDQIAALFTEGLYVNVHTDTNGAGEIRGQIVLADGQCECDDTRKAFTKCVKDAIKVLDKEDKKSAAVKDLKKAVKRSFCGKRKKAKRAIGCCLVPAPVENIVTGRLCAAVPEGKCTKFGGMSKGAGSDCAEPFCSPSGAFIDGSDLF
jgi:hypothetical protein